MKNSITFTSFKWKHYKELRAIVIEAFQWKTLVKSAFNLQLFSHIYVLGCLSKSNYQSIAMDNHTPVGIIMGRSNSMYRSWRKWPLKIIAFIMTLFASGLILLHRHDRNALKTELAIEAAIQNLVDAHSDSFDGEVTLLALNAHYRGYGIGKSLLDQFKAFMKAHHEKNYYLYTETTISTYTFYERQGLKRVAEKFLSATINKKPFETNLLIFEGQVD